MMAIVLPIGVAFLLCSVAAWYGLSIAGSPPAEVACAFAACLVYCSLLFMAFVPKNLDRARALLNSPKRLVGFAFLLWLPHLLQYLFPGSPSPWAALQYGAFIWAPVLLILARGQEAGVGLLDWGATLCLWLAIDLRMLDGAWPILGGGLNYPLSILVGVLIAVCGFVVYRRLPGVGYDFRPKAVDLKTAGVLYAVLLMIVLPLAWSADFITWNPQVDRLEKLASLPLIVLFIALPEELLFRGLIQNFVQTHTGKAHLSLGLTSILFGLTHLNNPPLYDYRYVALATICGAFYGYAWMRTRRLLAPALVHAFIDWVWVLLFMKS